MMEFLHPSAIWWLAGVLPAILLLYFLRLRRTPLTISSTLLWRWAVEDMRANAPFQRLRASVLLLLQLLVMTACLLALAQPFLQALFRNETEAAILLDCSASMGTRDGANGSTRLDMAKRKAHAIIDAMGTDENRANKLCVIAVSSQARLVCEPTTDARLLHAAVESIRMQETDTQMEQGLRMAISVLGHQQARPLSSERDGASPRARTAPVDKEKEPASPTVASPPDAREGAAIKDISAKENLVGENLKGEDITEASSISSEAIASPVVVYVISDGAFKNIPSDVTRQLAPPPDSRFFFVGSTDTENAGITAADVSMDARTDARTLFVRVENHGAARVGNVTLHVNDVFFDRKPIELAASSPDGAGAVAVTFSLPTEMVGQLAVTLDVPDVFQADNKAFFVLTPNRPRKVLLVSGGNPFLENFLGVMPGVEADRLLPDAWTPEDFPDGQRPHYRLGTGEYQPYDLVIFDRWTPKVFPPMGAYLVMGALPSLEGVSLFTTVGEDEVWWPMVLDWQRQHPLLRYITSLDSLQILHMPYVHFSTGWVPLVEGQGILKKDKGRKDASAVTVPLVAVHVTDARRVAVVAFDLYATSVPGWPAQISFSLFMGNAIEWLGRRDGMDANDTHTGHVLHVTFQKEARHVSLSSPDGREISLIPSAENSILFADTTQVGFYAFQTDQDEGRTFACNLLSETESDIAERGLIQFGGVTITGQEGYERGRVDFWPWLVVAGLLLLMLEWHVYNRRVLG